MKVHLIAAVVVAGMATTAAAETFTIIEDNRFRNDAATGIFELPSGVTEAGADLTFDGITTDTTGEIGNLDSLHNGSGFGAGDSIEIYGQMLGGQDAVRFTFNSPFQVSLDFQSDASQINAPIWRLYQGSTLAGTVLSETTLGAVSRGSPAALFAELGPIAGGTYVLEIEGSVGAVQEADRETYDVFISSIAAVPVPAGLPLLIAGLGSLALLRRRRT